MKLRPFPKKARSSWSGTLRDAPFSEGAATLRYVVANALLANFVQYDIGGVLDASGKPAFANARYVMSKTEWDFWTIKPDLHGAGMDVHMKELLVNCAMKNLPPLKARMEFVEDVVLPQQAHVVAARLMPTT